MGDGEFISDAEDFRKQFDVSRETLDRLEIYVALLKRWQARINLIGRSTVDSIWNRHIGDAAQLLDHLPAVPCTIVDVGTGAGIPGLVLSLLMADRGGGHAHLVESNARKSAFLLEAVRLTGAPATVHTCRIEDIDVATLSPPPQAVTARALAPLADLLNLTEKFLNKGAVGIFMKGQDVDDELTNASKYWRISAERMPSRIHKQGSILIVREAIRVDI